MKNLNIKVNERLSLNGVVTNIAVNDTELIIESTESISFISAEGIAKYLINTFSFTIEKITFKELLTC